MKEKATITFHGGTGTVTGANFLLEIGGKRILVDCGLTQGYKVADDVNWDPFTYDPKTVDALFITHGHVDHIGRIPKLIYEGFRGQIYSTEPTRGIALPMLEDTAGILNHNTELELDKIYTEENINIAFSHWTGLGYREKISLTPELEAAFFNAGHILGSAMILFSYRGKKILFTGDLGNSPSPLLPDFDKVSDVDYLIMESVYGDRNHESRESRRLKLAQVIQDNHKRQGTLIIPTFSLERSQELMFELDSLLEDERIPVMPIFFDSPLAIRLTDVFKQYKSYFNETAAKAMSPGKYLFDFPGLHHTLRIQNDSWSTRPQDSHCRFRHVDWRTGGTSRKAIFTGSKQYPSAHRVPGDRYARPFDRRGGKKSTHNRRGCNHSRPHRKNFRLFRAYGQRRATKFRIRHGRQSQESICRYGRAQIIHVLGAEDSRQSRHRSLCAGEGTERGA